MRQLHRVSTHERFLASGIYTYYHNDKPTGAVEQWSIHQQPDESQLIRVDRDARQPHNMSLLLEALRGSSGQIERFDVYFMAGSAKPLKASYIFFDGYVTVGRTLQDGQRRDEQIVLPSNVVIYPLMRVFTGPVIRQAAAQQGSVPVFLAWISDPADERFLSGMIDYRTANLVEPTSAQTTQAYQFTGGSYDSNARFWLDEHDMLLRYVYKKSEDNEESAVLTRYARRPVS